MGSDITELELEEVSYLKEADLQKNAGEPEPPPQQSEYSS